MKATDLMRDLSLIKCGWHRQENIQTRAAAMFPETSKDVADWERDCQTMHAAQTSVMLKPKPLENIFARNQIVRGD